MVGMDIDSNLTHPLGTFIRCILV
ncbi:hypothetical protein BDFB_014851 [Asbolus verrucosus]|uniref:Uncharacterized protein n=1 Tax=Asbolus verrucosus TaxID=1661398 RepID=A0A482V1A5_ASBVE|nr:hypothetical protein BDFB_014851 [Asbolus verrucosus]